MKKCIVTLKSVGPLVQGKHVTVDKLPGESAPDYEQRTWKNRLHIDENGNVILTPQMFKNCLSSAAQFLGMKIPGKGNSQYTKHFVSGIMVTDNLVLPLKSDDVKGMWLFVPSDGKRGGSKRVDKCFPIIESWEGTVTFYILDPVITEDIFLQFLTTAGNFIGVGSFRPACNGSYGRFKIVNSDWIEDTV